MRTNLFKNIPLLIFFALLGNYSFGQNTAGITGVTYTMHGITKSMAEVMAYERAHPVPANFKPPIRHDDDGPRNLADNPAAMPVSSFSSMVSSAINSRSNPVSINTPTQAIHSNFLSIWGSYAGQAGNESPYTPPDNNGDVGTTQIIATANCRMKVFTKPSPTAAAVTTPTGSSTTTLASVLNVDLNAFFTISSIGVNSISDPHVRFDRLTQRWFVLAIDVNHNTNNYCIIAVSDGPTVTASSNFTFFYFRPSTTGGASADFYDYPTLGIDKTSLYIGGNMFASGLGCNMWVVNKASLIAGTLSVSGFAHGTTNTNMFTPQGVQNDDPNSTEGYFIGASLTVNSRLVMRRVTYPGGVPTLSADIILTTQTTAAPANPPSGGGGTALDADDQRPFAAMIATNQITGAKSLWTAQHSRMTIAGVGSGTGDREGAVWYEIGTLTTTPTILRSASYYDGTNTGSAIVSYLYPSIAMTGQGHNAIGMTTTGTNKYPTATVAGRYRTDASTTFQASSDLTNNNSKYSPGANRWGDYTQTVVDPSDDQTIWTFTQYANTTNSWGVRAGQLLAPPPATPSLATNPPARNAVEPIVINGTSVNNSEFFDPGPDTNGPGFNRLQVVVDGPATIPVSNVVFVSPTQITANLNTLGAPDGTYCVVVINPDGQKDSTCFTLSTPLPVTLLNFTGKAVNSTVQLNWLTSAEISTKNFQVEKSGDGNIFQNLVSVSPRGTRTSGADYSSVDAHPYPGYSYYRLKVYNMDGSFTYSNVVKIKTAVKSITITRLYPNPTSSVINLELAADNQQLVNIEVYDVSGKKMMSQQLSLSSGINEKQLSLSNFASGTYFVRFKDAQNNIIENDKVVKE